MSFYDLAKDSVLSAKGIFKYRVKCDSTIPDKGGQKDFEPDGSWIQTKALEVFMQERSRILAEPRVEKLKNLAQGEWDSSKCLINIKKPGKFWSHMGFSDNKQNWLFPEEGLFLMEANALEVYDSSIPLSIQEAYMKFLGSDVSVEEYQVFSYLQRLGFVVLRHEEHPSITQYERKINLDKYLQKRHRVERKCKARQKDNQKMTPEGDGQQGDKSPKVTVVDLNMLDTNSEIKMNGSSTLCLSEGVVSTTVLSNKVPDCDGAASHVNPDGKPPGSLGSKEDPSSSQAADITDSLMSVDNDHNSADITDSLMSVDNDHNSAEPRTDFAGLQANGKINSSLKNENHIALPEPVNKANNAHPAVEKRSISEVDSAEDNPSSKKQRGADEQGTDSEESSAVKDDSNLRECREFYLDSWVDYRSKFNSVDSEKAPQHSSTSEDGTSCMETNCSKEMAASNEMLLNLAVSFPNIANTELLNLVPPDQKLLPPNVEIFTDEAGSLIFDVNQYKLNHQKKSRKKQKEEERGGRTKTLQFSYPKCLPGHSEGAQVTFTNWASYKKKMKETAKESCNPVAHYWEGDVTPLVHPTDAVSYEAILNRLSIIETADNETLTPDPDCMISIKISYDVHLPDSKFKKSMPGVPHHRVCVTKSSTDPPGLAEFQELWSRFKDNVPIHWAVVDSGEISFYVFDNTQKIEVWK